MREKPVFVSKKSKRNNRIRRKRINMIRQIKSAGVMLLAIPLTLIVCKCANWVDFSWPMIALICVLGCGFNIGALFVSLAWINNRDNKKNTNAWAGTIFWAINILLVSYVGYHATAEVLAPVLCIAISIAVCMMTVGKTRDMVFYGCEGAILMVVLGIHLEYSPEQYMYQILVVALCEIIQYYRQKIYTQRTTDESIIEEQTAMAETDPMTKLLNRRGLERRIASTWPMCQRQGTEVAIIMMDIDYFKKYNDAFGHPQGDECIRKVTAQIAYNVRRQTDCAARVGGEEFLVYLYGISPQEALNWAKHLKDNIERLLIPHAANNFLPYVTVSMGVVAKQVEKGDTFWELQELADKQLYNAKECGRACISMNDQCYAKVKSQTEINNAAIRERGFHIIN